MNLHQIRKTLFVAGCIYVHCQLAGQSITVDGEYRPRIEVRDGLAKPILDTYDPAVLTLQRTRLNVNFKSGNLNTLISLQDARTFGQNPNASDVATMGIYEAWAEMIFLPGASFKIGRQALSYDDRRMFSGSNWSNTGTSHDMGLLKYCINDFVAHVGVAYNNNTAISNETYYTPVDKYRYMGLVWLSKDIVKGLNITGLGVDEGVQDTTSTGGLKNYKKITMNHAYTFGGNLKYENDSFPISALATAYFNAGKNATGVKMNGKMLAMKINGKFLNRLKVTVAGEYFSGDSNTKDAIQTNFKKLYGTDHEFNGSMEYWKTPLNEGLLDYYAGLGAVITEKLSVEGTYHLFSSEYDLMNKAVDMGKKLGSEVDWVLKYKLNEYTNIEAGYSRYYTTSTLLFAKGLAANADILPPQWAYVMFTIRPTLK
jgi:Alginate export